MKDVRHELLAKQLLEYSVKIQKGEVLYLELTGADTLALGKEIVKLTTKLGATPILIYNDAPISRQFIKNCNVEQIKKQAEIHLEIMKKANAYISINGSNNPFELADIDPKKLELITLYYDNPVHYEERVKRTKWVILSYPNNSMAQLAQTSQESFEDFYFEVCLADYAKMSKAQDKLIELINKTDKVRIISPGTDLTFSIKDIPKVKCDGIYNIPDGEVYTAPVRESVNGTITYNTPSLYDGVVFQNISFTFKNGKIVEARCDGHTDKLNKILDIDEGARYIGEFAFGVNPFILHPMKDTLFDEKIAGSIHLTPGSCYDDAFNGNNSALHWDLVLIQRSDYGGGEIWLDDKLFRKDGIFVDSNLEYLFSQKNLKI